MGNCIARKIRQFEDSTSYYKNKKIALIGSTQFKNNYFNVASRLELMGFVVLTTHTFEKFDKLDISDDDVDTLVKLGEQRILMSNAVVVIDTHISLDSLPNMDVVPYVGTATQREIHLAESWNKPVFSLAKTDLSTLRNYL